MCPYVSSVYSDTKKLLLIIRIFVYIHFFIFQELFRRNYLLRVFFIRIYIFAYFHLRFNGVLLKECTYTYYYSSTFSFFFSLFSTVTLVTLVIMGMLFMYELHDYLTPKLAEDLFVDTTRGSKLRINLDVVFPSIPCNSMYARSNVSCVLIYVRSFEDKNIKRGLAKLIY